MLRHAPVGPSPRRSVPVVTVVALLGILGLLVVAAAPAQGALPKVAIKGFDSSTLTMAVNTTWRDALQVGTAKGRKVLVQRSRTSTGPWTTVSTLYTGSNGALTVSIRPTAVATNFWRLLTPKTARTAATASKAKKIIAKQTYPLYVAGPVSGSYQPPSGAWRLTWQGTVTFTHEPLDPFLGTPWTDGKVHYRFFSGSFDWAVEDLGGSCQESGSGTKELVPGTNSVGDMTITRAKTTKGWKWSAYVALNAGLTGGRMDVEVVCPPLDEEDEELRYVDDFSIYVKTGTGSLVYNGVADATSSNIYTTSLKTFAGTTSITNPTYPGYEQVWVQNMSGSVFDLI